MIAPRTPTRIVACGLLALALTLLPARPAEAAPAIVSSGIAKVAVDKVLRVELDPTPATDAKLRRVRILTRSTFPRCTAGAIWYYKEGKLEDNEYYSLWAAEQPDCPKARAEDVIFTLELPVGQKHAVVLRGAKRYDQRVSFQLAPDGVRSLMIKKMVAR